MCSSPKLIAAYHVLHRLSDPRHPPYALNCFKKFKIYTLLYKSLLLNSLLIISNMSKNFLKAMPPVADNVDLNHLLPVELPNF